MKIGALVVSLLALSGSQAVSAADPTNGKRLFDTSRCMSCHTAESFSVEKRKVKDYAALESQVRRCDANLSTNWFDDQILDVVAYLNQNYYKFPTPPATGTPVVEPKTD